MNEVIHFHNSLAFTGGRVDHQSCVISGVSLIKPGIEAEGHGLWVDDTTAKQLVEFAKSKGKVPVNMDHGSGITSMNGYIDNVRMDNGRPRGDWHLLKTHDDTPTMLERAETMPECFGLSAAFKGDPKGTTVDGRQCARVEKLLSFDVVVRPAANDGLFSAKDGGPVDISKIPESQKQPAQAPKTALNFMADQTPEPTLAELMQAISALTQQVQSQAEMQQQIIGHINGETENQGDEPTLEDFYNASDEELAQYNELNGSNITRDQIMQAVAEHDAQIDAQGQEGQEGAEGQEGDGQFAGSYAPEGAGAAAGASGGSTALGAIQRELIQLKAKFNAKEKAEIQFAEAQEAGKLEQKFTQLVKFGQRVAEENDLLKSKIEALELHVRTGTRPVKAGVDSGIRLFGVNGTGELHPFQQRLKAIEAEKKCTPGQAILFAMKEPNGPALHADWLQSQETQTIHA